MHSFCRKLQTSARAPDTELSQTMSSDVPIRLFPGPPRVFCTLQISFFILSVYAYLHTCFPGHVQSRNSEFLHNQGTTYFLTQVLPPLCLCLPGQTLFSSCYGGFLQVIFEKCKICCLCVLIKYLLCASSSDLGWQFLLEGPFSLFEGITHRSRNVKQYEVRWPDTCPMQHGVNAR